VEICSEDVNEYLQTTSGQPFSGKDFRTWAGTALAAIALDQMEVVDSKAPAKKKVITTVEAVARMLGNTAAICRKVLYPSRDYHQIYGWKISSNPPGQS
jgi:DNA topoisomerase I